ncbi:(3S,6E)-nerolidol synthase [Trifolium repens]|nr:(3S,6E)-nerolidol synthase [Trifolium repens]
MAIHFISNGQFSQSFNHLKSHSLHIVNKWDINHVEEQRFTTLKKQPRDFSSTKYHHLDKLEVVKQELRNVGGNSLKGLYMIDAMQRLNIDYHFQEEIEEFLTRYACGWNHHCDLHETALRFRLLRQQGHFVPTEVFNKFTNKEEKFNPKLGENINGMINLFEASQLIMAGEDILAEAGEFSKNILKEKMAQFDYHEAISGKIGFQFVAMLTPTRDCSNFQMVRWRELGLVNELPYARNQPLKWYIWSLACLRDPTLSEERIELTKPISLIYIIDDIFDIYGSLDELTLFTKAVSR